jgi:hypothetical protein
MLSFEITNSGKAIQIDCDREGLQALISVLEEFKTKEVGHVHLRAPSAGGRSLSDKTPWGKEAVGEVIISLGGDI